MARILPIYTPAGSEDEAAPPAYTPPYTQPQTTTTSEDATVQIWPLPDNEGLIVTVKPPQAPQDEELSHIPCDIVLVIDVSGSMSTEARIPGSSNQESTGLSVLDLVKHACRTILSTLNENDQLAIITFSNNATEVQKLIFMTDANKETAKENIENMCVQGATNLWAGLRKGIECLGKEENLSRIPAIMLLTDGLPNYMCPPGGYVPALRDMGKILPTVHTFGFGFQLRSGLLKSIAEFGRGNYSFIPDTGMIGTVFVHAVAHLQSTFATNAVLSLVYPDHMAIDQTGGPSVDQSQFELMDGSRTCRLTIPLGNIQYGQSRDILFNWTRKAQKSADDDTEYIQATFGYDLRTKAKCTLACTGRLKAGGVPFTSAEIAYHISRHKILAFLASIFPIDPLGEHRTCIPPVSRPKKPLYSKAIQSEDWKKRESNKEACQDEEKDYVSEPLRQKQEELESLITTLPAAEYPNDPQCTSLLQDLISPEPFGQISLALSKQEYFERWGQHYLPSIHGAHARQLCNSFKDPGPLQYGVGSPLFIDCRNALNTAFNDLPPPVPSILPVSEPHLQAMSRFRPGSTTTTTVNDLEPDGGDLLRSQAYATMNDGRKYKKPASMRDWNDPSNPCFAGHTLVMLASGGVVRISALKGGMSVVTPMGPRKVAMVLVSPVKRAVMVKLNGVLVTPWHPVSMPGGKDSNDEGNPWLFPCHASQERVRYTGCIYSILLQRDENADTHAILLGDGLNGVPFWGVTLGHGILIGSDRRAHHFFGDYECVSKNLERLQVKNDRRVVTGGTVRSKETGLVCGFKAYAAVKPVPGSISAMKRHLSRHTGTRRNHPRGKFKNRVQVCQVKRSTVSLIKG